ncbi:MAG: polysaccharide deacetylase family protein [Chloroflexi bacterium]|nr:polysaccharide deacetylase family protein [Chloroflexota bacterium]
MAKPRPSTSSAAASVAVPPIVVRGDAGRPVAALTFDAGAGAGSTADVLDALQEFGVRSTFFLTGEWADANQDLVRRIVADGHEVSNHSYSHPDMTTVGEDRIVSELARTEAAVQRIAGVTTKPYFRPPFGAYDARLLRILAQQGYRAIYWTLDSTDWRDDSTTQSVLRRVINSTGNGYIVVHHSSSPKTAEALRAILRELKAKGFALVKLSEMLD